MYDAEDRLLSYGAASFVYAPTGDRTQRNANGETTSYSYDAFGNLIRVTLPDGTIIDYVIDAQNRRIGRKINGLLVQGFLYESQLAIGAELDASGQVVSRFIYGRNGSVPEYMQKGGNTYRIVTDHLGSVRLVIDAASGAIAQQIDYDEYGRALQNSNPGFQPFGYAGGFLDDSTGLIHFGVRDYDADPGRWIERDPVHFAGTSANLYTYVDDDPINHVDPVGMWKTDVHNKMIRDALVNHLTIEDITKVQNASAAFDNPWPVRSHDPDVGSTQGAADSYMHSMRDGLAGQSAADALRQRDTFVMRMLMCAKAYAEAGPQYRDDALRFFAIALHPLMDSTSPEHMDGGVPLPWYGEAWYALAGDVWHSHKEGGIIFTKGTDAATPQQYSLAEQLIMYAYQFVFGQ